MAAGAADPAGSGAGALTPALRPQRGTVTLGEPVFLELSLRNGLDERVHVDLGHDRRSNLAFTVRLPGGRTEQPPTADEEGMGLVGRQSLGPGEELRERLLLNEWLTPGEPGTYRVAVRLTAPATTDDGRRIEVPPSPPVEVRVEPRNAERLEAACLALANTVLHGRDAQDGLDAARALARVADPVAVPFLAAVARNAGRGALQAIAGLARIGTREAAAALLEAMEHRELRSHALRALRVLMEQTEDAKLRTWIAEALRESG